MSHVATNKVVAIHYTLKDNDGEVIDSSAGSEPLMYLHGHDNIVPGLERQLTGAAIGDKLEAKVPAAEGYGEASEDAVQKVPADAFPPDAGLEPGMQFAAEDNEGNIIPLWVVAVEGDHVLITNDHPLAGVDLNFSVEVVAVRDATAEEIDHGHPHGPGGHQH